MPAVDALAKTSQPTPAAPAAVAPARSKARVPADVLAVDRLHVSGPAAAADAPAAGKTPKLVKAAPATAPKLDLRYRLTGMLSFFTNILTAWLLDPRLLAGHVKTVFGQLHRMAVGVASASGWAREAKAASKAGTISTFLKTELKAGGQKISNLGGQIGKKIGGLFDGKKAAGAAMPAAEAAVASTVRNEGVVAFYAAARTAGKGPVGAIGEAFSKVLSTGGDMPQITAHAAGLGGKWGKAFLWTGTLARLAPLLNVPIAAFDLVHAVQTMKNPRTARRERVARVGQAVLSTIAGGTALAAFLVPAPLDVLLLRIAGIAGFGSLGWGIATSRPVVSFFQRVGRFFGHTPAAPAAAPAPAVKPAAPLTVAKAG